MSYAIFRMQKVHTTNVGNLEMHNERKTDNHSNKDINTKLSKNNVQLVECKSYKKAIQKNINNYYKSDRNIRKDAVIAVETIFTSDYEFFKNKTEKEKELFFEKSLEFLKEFVGEKNIIAATIHYDETTPHMHCVFTPIDDDGRLKYKSFVSHKNDLIKLQDKYYEKMSLYFPELERGKSAKETERRYLSTEEFKQKKELEKEIINLKNKNEELQEKNNDLESKNNALYEITEQNEFIIKKQKEKIDKKIKEERELEKKIEDLKNEIENIEKSENTEDFLNSQREYQKLLEKNMEDIIKKVDKSMLQLDNISLRERNNFLAKDNIFFTEEKIKQLKNLEDRIDKVDNMLMDREKATFGGYKFSLEEINKILDVLREKKQELRITTHSFWDYKELQKENFELKKLNLFEKDMAQQFEKSQLKDEILSKNKKIEKLEKTLEVFFETYPENKKNYENIEKTLFPEKTNHWKEKRKKEKSKDIGWER